ADGAQGEGLGGGEGDRLLGSSGSEQDVAVEAVAGFPADAAEVAVGGVEVGACAGDGAGEPFQDG
ncbi:hypothetical protein ACFQMG_21035, partial [Kitasatospora paranensis]